MRENQDLADLLEHLASMPGAFRDGDRGELREWATMLRAFPQPQSKAFRDFVGLALERERESVPGLVKRLQKHMAGDRDERLVWSLGKARSKDLKAILLALGERAGRTATERRERLMELANLRPEPLPETGHPQENIEGAESAFLLLKQSVDLLTTSELRERAEAVLGSMSGRDLAVLAKRVGVGGSGAADEVRRGIVRMLEDEKVRRARQRTIKGQW